MGDIFGGGGNAQAANTANTSGSSLDQLFSNAAIGEQAMGGTPLLDNTGTGAGGTPFDISQLFSALTQTTDPTGSVGATAALSPPSAGTPSQQAADVGGTQSAGAPAQSTQQPSGGDSGGQPSGGGDSGGQKQQPQDLDLKKLLSQLLTGRSGNPWQTGQTQPNEANPQLAAQLAVSNQAKLAKASQLQAPIIGPRPEGGETVVPRTTPGPTATAPTPAQASPSPTVAPGPPSGGGAAPGQPIQAAGPPGASIPLPGGGQLPIGLAQLAILALGGLGGRGGAALAPLAAAILERAVRGPRPQPGWPQPGAWRQQMDNFDRGPWAGDPWHTAMVGAESSGRNSGSGRPEDGPAGDNGQSFGFFNIKRPTWNQYKKGVPGAEQFTSAEQAPYAIQKAVADRMPIGIYGQRTRDILHRRFGAFDERTTVGALAQRFGGVPVESTTPPGPVRPPKRGPPVSMLDVANG